MWLCYNVHVVASHSGNRREVHTWKYSFLVSVMAGVVSYYICKWLGGNDSDN